MGVLPPDVLTIISVFAPLFTGRIPRGARQIKRLPLPQQEALNAARAGFTSEEGRQAVEAPLRY